jgi:hypothetical protein
MLRLFILVPPASSSFFPFYFFSGTSTQKHRGVRLASFRKPSLLCGCRSPRESDGCRKVREHGFFLARRRRRGGPGGVEEQEEGEEENIHDARGDDVGVNGESLDIVERQIHVAASQRYTPATTGEGDAVHVQLHTSLRDTELLGMRSYSLI